MKFSKSWFQMPKLIIDSPILKNQKHPPAELMEVPTSITNEEPPRPEEEIADNISMHEKMYRIATDKYNPFSVGGSESIQDIKNS